MRIIYRFLSTANKNEKGSSFLTNYSVETGEELDNQGFIIYKMNKKMEVKYIVHLIYQCSTAVLVVHAANQNTTDQAAYKQ